MYYLNIEILLEIVVATAPLYSTNAILHEKTTTYYKIDTLDLRWVLR